LTKAKSGLQIGRRKSQEKVRSGSAECRLNNIKSISLLITEIDTSTVARELDLIKAFRSMYSEAFVRYRSTLFRNLFHRLLEQLNFLGIPELQLLGRLVCVDVSIIPAMKTVAWAKYKTSSNALKIHLVFELNRMIPMQSVSTDANTSERNPRSVS